MRHSVKAALCSAFLFPGCGHLIIKKRALALPYMTIAIVCLSIIVTIAAQKASRVLEKIQSNGFSYDVQSVMQEAAIAAQGPGTLVYTIAIDILIICWIVAFIDAARLGHKQDRQQTS